MARKPKRGGFRLPKPLTFGIDSAKVALDSTVDSIRVQEVAKTTKLSPPFVFQLATALVSKGVSEREAFRIILKFGDFIKQVPKIAIRGEKQSTRKSIKIRRADGNLRNRDSIARDILDAVSGADADVLKGFIGPVAPPTAKILTDPKFPAALADIKPLSKANIETRATLNSGRNAFSKVTKPFDHAVAAMEQDIGNVLLKVLSSFGDFQSFLDEQELKTAESMAGGAELRKRLELPSDQLIVQEDLEQRLKDLKSVKKALERLVIEAPNPRDFRLDGRDDMSRRLRLLALTETLDASINEVAKTLSNLDKRQKANNGPRTKPEPSLGSVGVGAPAKSDGEQRPRDDKLPLLLGPKAIAAPAPPPLLPAREEFRTLKESLQGPDARSDGAAAAVASLEAALGGVESKAGAAGQVLLHLFDNLSSRAGDFTSELAGVTDALAGIGGKAGDVFGILSRLFGGGGSLEGLLGGLGGPRRRPFRGREPASRGPASGLRQLCAI